MSFTRLPTELKMHLIKLSHEMRLEETRQDLGGHQVSVFNGGYQQGPAYKSKETRMKVLSGSVVECMSLVNKELRSIALPYLFEVSLFFAFTLNYSKLSELARRRCESVKSNQISSSPISFPLANCVTL